MRGPMEPEKVLITGYAKLPANITCEEVYKILAVVVVVDMSTGVIEEAECSVVTGVAREFSAGIIKGYNMNDGPEELIDKFERLYQGNAKKAIQTSLKIIFKKYDELRQKE
jgi:hypothetical protein